MKTLKETFNFPVRVYDRVSISRVEKTHRDFFEEEKYVQEDDLKEEPAWVQGWMRVDIDELKGWGDVMSIDEEVTQVAKEGFNLCMVFTNTLGEFICTWKKTQFEQKLNEHFKKMGDD